MRISTKIMIKDFGVIRNTDCIFNSDKLTC